MQEEQERIMNEQWKFEQANIAREQQMMDRMMQEAWRKEQEIHRQQMIEFAKNREKMWTEAERRAEEEEIRMESDLWTKVTSPPLIILLNLSSLGLRKT